MSGGYFPSGDYTSGLIEYCWCCARCGAKRLEIRHFSSGMPIWNPGALPAGWNKVGEDIYCPAHRIKTFIDDKLAGAEGQQ